MFRELPPATMEYKHTRQSLTAVNSEVTSHAPTPFGFLQNELGPETRPKASEDPRPKKNPSPLGVRRRRGPGRPSKAEQDGGQSIRPKKPPRALRRDKHNDSATRSRAKFASALDQLWEEVPEKRKMQAIGGDIGRQLCRAEKVEIAISYVQNLQTKLGIN